jgi:hypothetical protein
VYSTCLHCHAPLGANEEIEHFPIGSRLAFDGANGRLWAVCPRCRRWNLTPVEERWDALEECERAYRATRLRVSSDRIALARTRGGMELVRIGEPESPEIAGWRYGRSLRRRWVRRGVPLAVLGAGMYPLNVAIQSNTIDFGVGFALIVGVPAAVALLLTRMSKVRVALPDGRVRAVSSLRALDVALEPADGGGWAITSSRWQGAAPGASAPAVHLLRGVMAAVNYTGGPDRDMRSAIDMLQAAGHPDRFLERLTRASRAAQMRNIVRHPRDVRLALEMALHESGERAAMQGELTGLREEWRLADEIARIADDMFLPEAVTTKLATLRDGGAT